MNKIIFCLIMTFVCHCTCLYPQVNRSFTERELKDGWSFKEYGTETSYPAEVPGTIHSDLLNNGLMENPFWGKNEESLRRLEQKDWQYETEFEVSEDELSHDAATLEFLGLDTYADVYLNGSHILTSDNMFIANTADVKSVLKAGKNRIAIVFYSPIRKTLAQWDTNGFDYPADNDRSDKHLSVFTRKAPYQYGWDWGMRLVGCGIWRPVKLRFYDSLKIDDWFVDQKVDRNKADINNEITISAVQGGNVRIAIDFSLDGTHVLTKEETHSLAEGMNTINMPGTIDNPQLWMPAGWGEPVLYDATLTITSEDGHATLDERQLKIGFRTVELVREYDSMGRSFYFKVNGIPLFAKGANYIPNDIIPTNFAGKDYDELFEDITAANMNMIRIWGGGYYEEPEFYEKADENGILIWQDFMFACSTYPADDSFLKNVGKEAEYNIKRLRNHACLALWCGNNEIYEGVKFWGWNKKYDEKTYDNMKKDYDRLFKEFLPQYVEKYDPGHQYLHTSPDTANWGRQGTLPYGDSHYWGIWYGKDRFEVMDTLKSRFVSEFGFESFPEMKTIKTFASEQDLDINSDVMKHRQKSSRGNDLIETYMGYYYKIPDNFDDFIYVGQILQGNGMRRAIEGNRRNRPLCMGSLYWQLNDSWPAISWSGIDYYRNWKSLHYQAAKAFAPVLITTYMNGDKLEIYAVSDRLNDIKDATLKYDVISFDGKKLNSGKIKTDIPANSSTMIRAENTEHFAAKDMRDKAFIKFTLTDSKGKTLNETLRYFLFEKDMALPETEIKTKIKVEDGQYVMTLSSAKLAKDVFIEVPFQGADFSDNFFDLLPGEKKTVTVKSEEIRKGDKAEARIRHLRMTYK